MLEHITKIIKATRAKQIFPEGDIFYVAARHLPKDARVISFSRGILKVAAPPSKIANLQLRSSEILKKINSKINNPIKSLKLIVKVDLTSSELN